MTEIKEFKAEFFECSCKTPNHVIMVSRSEDGLWLQVQLNQYNRWYKRIWLAIKYVFNRVHRDDMHWDCWLLDVDDVERFKKQFDGLEEDMIRYHNDFETKTTKRED